jgi:hypothetical protein
MQFYPTEERLKTMLKAALDAFEDPGRYDAVRNQNGSYIHVNRDIGKLENYCDFHISVKVYWDIVYECLETAIVSPKKSYRQPKDYICSHEEALDETMWAFEVQHEDFSKNLYVKFCIVESTNGENYIHIDCHP